MIVEEVEGGERITHNLIIDLEKAGSKEGLIPIRKTVTRKGKTYEQTFYVRPKDLHNMQVENTVQLMNGMIKAQKHFKSVLDKVEAALPDTAAAVYDKMQKAGQKMVKIGELNLELAEHSRQNPVTGDDMLAAIHNAPDSDIPVKVKEAINGLYKKVSTTTFGQALEVKTEGSTRGTKIRTTVAEKPTTWAGSKWTSKLKEILTKKVSDIKGIFSLRESSKTPVDEEAKPKKKTVAKGIQHYLHMGGDHE